LLETTREYGLECLCASGELEVTQRAHAAYYLALVEKAVPHLRCGEQAVWLERLEREYENIVAALRWSIERGGEDAERSLRLSGALAIFWWIRGHLQEGRDILERALAGSGEYMAATRAKALYEIGWMLISTDTMQAEALSGESLKLYRMLGHQQGIAEALNSLGQIAWQKGKFAEGCLLLEESLQLFRGICDKSSIAWAVLCLACLALDQGEHAKALPYLAESLTFFREASNTLGVAYVLNNLARAFLDQGDALAACPLLEESLQLFRELGNKNLTARTLAYLGRACHLRGDSVRARSLFKEALTTFQEKEARRDVAQSLFFLANVAVSQKDYFTAISLYKESLTIFTEINYRGGIDIPCCLEGLARAVVGQGQPAWAARLAGAAETLRETSGVRLLPVEHPTYKKLILTIRTQLGKQVFATMWAEGRTMTLEQVLAMQGQEPVMILPLIAGKQSYPANLTEREMEVLRLLVNGLANNKIAEHLIISSHTVNAHVRSIFNKLEVNSRSALTRSALERNLI
jgi:DNA-binding CsgD family transcriptional regulator